MQTGVLGLVGIMELMWTTNILQRIFVGRELPGRQIHSDPDADVVVKNVAGYDMSRLQYGALGTLGIITATRSPRCRPWACSQAAKARDSAST